MQLFVGLIGLVIALALVGALLRTQLKSLRSPPTPAAASAAGVSAPATPAQASQRMQRQVADDIGKALEQGARRNDDAVGR